MKKKILLLFCGGTIVMEKNEEGVLAPPNKERAMQSLMDLEPKIEQLALVDVVFIDNIDSTNITPSHWDLMAQVIFDRYDDYDGFVVTHGTDTMAYSASALAFALQNLGKPIVFTGSQIPGYFLESDARRNLINALRVAVMDVAAVMLVFSEKIILGVRASKVSHTELEAFASINRKSLGYVGVNIRFHEKLGKKPEKPLSLELGFDGKIAVISLVPGMPITVLEELLTCDLHGIILVAYGSGNIPEIYLPFLEKAQTKKMPVVIRTQCLEGSTSMDIYATGKQALRHCVIEVYDMSLETTITKLMWALKRGVSYEEIKTIMQKNYAGEISL
ncbi:MAG: asparaginase [Chlamydiota bacterium]